MNSPSYFPRLALWQCALPALVMVLTSCDKKAQLDTRSSEVQTQLMEQREQMEKLRKEVEQVSLGKSVAGGSRQEQELRRRIESAQARKSTLDQELEQTQSSLKKLQDAHQVYRTQFLKP